MGRVLDPCCGGRMMWFNRMHPDVVFGDCRSGAFEMTDRSHGKVDGKRQLLVTPDVLLDFKSLPFDNSSFSLVVFDPPHIVRAGPRSWLAAKYGKLGTSWQADLQAGFKECLRVLTDDGVLIFKWNETQISVGQVLEQCPLDPLFGHRSGKKSATHWLVFMKPHSTEGEDHDHTPG